LEQTAQASSDSGSFARDGYLLLRGLIEPPLTLFLWSYAHTKFASQLMHSGDRLFPSTVCSYGDPAFDGLLEHLRPRIEGAVGTALVPTYSYFRIHQRGDVLRRHRDRPASEIVATLNIGQMPAAPWPFTVDAGAGPVRADLLPGDAMIYRGHEHFHWRSPFEGDRLVQASLSYVERDGPHAGEKFDSRPTLMRRPQGPRDGA
jgi:hypothetical protein